MSVEARQLARQSTTMDISDWRACSEFTTRSNAETAARGLSFDYHCIKGYSNVFELGKFWAPDAEDMLVLARTGADPSTSPLVRAQALSTRGYLSSTQGDTEAAVLDYRTALAIARAASLEDRKRMEWLMTAESGASTGQLIDNLISEISRRLESLAAPPEPSHLDRSQDSEDHLLSGIAAAAAGKWRTAADLYRRVYETNLAQSTSAGTAPGLANAAFSSYVDAFRLAHTGPSSDDIEFLERVASDPAAPALVRAQAWAMRGLVAWSWSRPDTAIWQLDEAVLWASSPTAEDRSRQLLFPDPVYGGYRNVSLGRMLDSLVEDATGERNQLSVKGPLPAFPGFDVHVFAPHERALMHEYASPRLPVQQVARVDTAVSNKVSSLAAVLVLLLLVVPMAQGLLRLVLRSAKRWQPVLGALPSKVTSLLAQMLMNPKASGCSPCAKSKRQSPHPSSASSNRRSAGNPAAAAARSTTLSSTATSGSQARARSRAGHPGGGEDPLRGSISHSSPQVASPSPFMQSRSAPHHHLLPATPLLGAAAPQGSPDASQHTAGLSLPLISAKVLERPDFTSLPGAHRVVDPGDGGDEELNKCKVCFDAPCQRGFYHGGSVHAGICSECADAVMATERPLCPFCRTPVDACVQIFG